MYYMYRYTYTVRTIDLDWSVHMYYMYALVELAFAPGVDGLYVCTDF